MKKTILFLALSTQALLAQNFTPEHEAKLAKLHSITYEDLAHENKGCPENSLCSESMGKRVLLWRELAKQLQANSHQKEMKLEAFRQQHGLPITFLTQAPDLKEIDPIVWNSRCTHHNIKDQLHIFKALQFFQKDPKHESVKLDSAILYAEKQKITYSIPYGDTPILIWQNRLVMAQDFEELYYYLSIDQLGSFKIVSPSSSQLEKAMLEKETVDCPEALASNQWYLKNYCYNIWNADTQKTQVIELNWACP